VLHVLVDMDASNQILRNIDARVRAVRAKDVRGLLAGYAGDVQTFDLVPPLEVRGARAVERRVRDWFDSFATEIDYELREIVLETSQDVAFDHHLVHVRGDAVTGEHVDMWFRETVGYRRFGDAWKVVHQHSSLPIDMTKRE
jgi:PhnB protein